MPVVSIYQLSLGQYGYKGHVIELDVLAVRKQSQRDFCVRRPVVQDFTWLPENIQYYRANAVHRNEDTLQQLPEDGNLPTFDLFTWVIHQPEPPED